MNHLVFFFSFVVLVTLCATQELVEERPCNLAFKCSLIDDPVWTTTDNKTCEVFRNSCLLASTNCNRQNNYQPEAIDIGQEECQKLCKTCCENTNATPICGYYNEEKRNFGSQCEMDNLICATGKTYLLYSEGLCPSE